MSEIIKFEDRRNRPQPQRCPHPIIKKVVDGEVVECVDLDALPPEALSEYLRDDPANG